MAGIGAAAQAAARAAAAPNPTWTTARLPPRGRAIDCFGLIARQAHLLQHSLLRLSCDSSCTIRQ